MGNENTNTHSVLPLTTSRDGECEFANHRGIYYIRPRNETNKPSLVNTKQNKKAAAITFHLLKAFFTTLFTTFNILSIKFYFFSFHFRIASHITFLALSVLCYIYI